MRIAMVLLAAGVAAFGLQSEKPSGTIAGQVVNQATGAPLPDAIVKLRYLTPSGDEIMIRQTNDAGRFSFTGLWGRDWELSAECRGFAPAWYRSSRYVPQGRFSLEKNQQLNDIVLAITLNRRSLTKRSHYGNMPLGLDARCQPQGDSDLLRRAPAGSHFSGPLVSSC